MGKLRGSTVLCVLLLAAMAAHSLSAAALGSVLSSLGLFAAFPALLLFKGWPTHLPATAVSSAALALVLAWGAARLWRSRLAMKFIGSAGSPSAHGAPARKAGVVAARALELPPDIDRDHLVAAMRSHFVRLQDAWDRGDAASLNRLVTPEMLDELTEELAGQGAAQPNRTEILALAAELLSYERLPQALLLGVEFSGLMREHPAQGAMPFRELWLLTRSEHEQEGWRLARQQALF